MLRDYSQLQCSRIIPYGGWGTMWGQTRHHCTTRSASGHHVECQGQDLVSCMKGKHLTCCTIALASVNSGVGSSSARNKSRPSGKGLFFFFNKNVGAKGASRVIPCSAAMTLVTWLLKCAQYNQFVCLLLVTPASTQPGLTSLCSGIIPDDAQGTIWSSRDKTRVSSVHGK